MKKKWSLHLTAAIVLALLLSACGDSGKANNAGESGSASGQPSDAQTSSGNEEVTLNFITWGPYTDEIFAAFNEQYPHIKINYQQVSGDNYNQVQRTRLAGGDDLDLMGVRLENYDEFVEAGFLVDLSEEPYMANYLDSAIHDVTADDGKVYAIPMGQNAEAVWYNKDLFAKLSLSVPTNWDEFLDVSQKLKDNGIIPLVQGNKDLWTNYMNALGPLHAIVAQDPQIADKLNSGQAKFTDPAFVEALQKTQVLM